MEGLSVPRKTSALRVLWACLRGVFRRLRRAEGRRRIAAGQPILGAILAGVTAKEMLALIRREPAHAERVRMYEEEVDRRVAPGGRLRRR